MGREYTISTGMKIFYILLAAGMFIFAFVLLKMPQSQSALLLMPVLFIAIAGLIIANVLRRKIIIYADSILYISLFSTKEIAISNVKGCRIGQKFITVETTDPNVPKLTINNYIDFANSDQLASWVKEHFKDLDEIDLRQDEEKVLHDTNLGYSEEDRKRALKTSGQIANVYNVIGFAGVFALLFLVSSYAAIIMGLIYPLLGLIVMHFSKGLIKFVGNNKRSVGSYLLLGFMGPIMILLFNSLDDYQIFQYNSLWLPISVTILVLFGLIYYTGINKAIDGIKGQVVFMFFIAAIYGFGSIINVNCAFDRSEPSIYKAKVLSHKIEHGKHTSYLLTLSEWGPMHQQKEEDVGRSLYQRVSIGDTVKIYFRPGLLKAPWYDVGL